MTMTVRGATARHEKQYSAKERNCMCCGKKFMSAGFHNRLCNQCRCLSIYLLDMPVVSEQPDNTNHGRSAVNDN